MASPYSTPGVYDERRPRIASLRPARTDVVGFLGFEPRIRDGSTPSELLGEPATGHAFRVDVSAFELPRELLGGTRARVVEVRDFVVSSDPASIPMAPGGTASFALVAALSGASVELLSVRGPVSSTETVGAATDDEIATVLGNRAWIRLANIEVRRSASGERVFPTVVPALPPLRCDDVRDFALGMGNVLNDDDGTLLAQSVRAFFANGGARCHVVPIRRPRFDDASGMARALSAMVGVSGASEAEATGLERLLRIEEIAIVDMPDLYARNVEPKVETWEIPPRDRNACFRACDETFGARASLSLSIKGQTEPLAPLFDDAQVLETQRAMLLRCAPERYRVLLLLAAPLELDVTEGRYRGPTHERAAAFRAELDGAVDDLASACAAFYHPWVLTQERVGAPTLEMPPTALVAGVIARRDLARGPHVAPANETLAGVVGLSPSLNDETLGRLYETPLHINGLSAFPGGGIQVWGARTLSRDRFMRYLPVRRCLSAIERRVLEALRPLVFEPNTPALWFQVSQAVLGVLLPVFQSGALRGSVPEEAFYVRCDDTNNPPETVMVGQVLCEVGVAIAAPLEFIVFRVGRREALVEVLE